MARLNVSKIPDVLPEGLNFYIYNVKDKSGESFGGFVGRCPEDIWGVPEMAEISPAAVIEIVRVNREQFISFGEDVNKLDACLVIDEEISKRFKRNKAM